MEQNPHDVLCMSPVSRATHHHVVPGNFSGEVNFGLSPLLAGLMTLDFPACLAVLFVFCFGINSANLFYHFQVGTKLNLDGVRNIVQDVDKLLPSNCGPAGCK